MERDVTRGVSANDNLNTECPDRHSACYAYSGTSVTVSSATPTLTDSRIVIRSTASNGALRHSSSAANDTADTSRFLKPGTSPTIITSGGDCSTATDSGDTGDHAASQLVALQSPFANVGLTPFDGVDSRRTMPAKLATSAVGGKTVLVVNRNGGKLMLRLASRSVSMGLDAGEDETIASPAGVSGEKKGCFVNQFSFF